MIQRIQTLYLGIASILLIVLFMVNIPLLELTGEDASYQLTQIGLEMHADTGVEKIGQAYAVMVSLVLSLLLSIYAVMQYRNRKFQITLVRFAMLMQLAFIASVVFYLTRLQEMTEGEVSYSPLLLVPIVNIVLYVLAIRGIRKDEELVRSADRLR